MSDACSHLDQVADVAPSSEGCEDCLRVPGEDWWFCYIDDLAFTVDGAPSFAHP